MVGKAAEIKKVLILGHSGFVGGRIARLLGEREPALEVRGFSLPELDLTREDQVAALGAELGPATALVHCAFLKRNWGDTLERFAANQSMAVNLCRVLEKHPAARLIYFSSAAVYGEGIDCAAIREDTPERPESYYGLAKYLSEKLYQKLPATRLAILRPPVIYGPGERERLYGPSGFAQAARAGERITLWGDGRERRDFVYVDDAAEVVWRLLKDDFSGTLNLATGQSHSFRECVDTLARVAGRPVECDSRPRTGALVNHGFDIARLRARWPDLPLTSLETGLRRCWEAP